MNRTDESIHSFEVLLEIDPGNGDAQYHKGLALAKLGDHRDAISAFEKTIGMLPSFAPAWYNKGRSLIHTGKYQEAIDCI